MKSALEKFMCITPESLSYSRYNSDVEQQKTYQMLLKTLYSLTSLYTTLKVQSSWSQGCFVCSSLRSYAMLEYPCGVMDKKYRIYDIYNGGSLHNNISKKTKLILLYQHLFICCWRYMFRPLCWVIIRSIIIQALVLELCLNSICSYNFYIHNLNLKLKLKLKIKIAQKYLQYIL
jgi:hypothetical protein